MKKVLAYTIAVIAAGSMVLACSKEDSDATLAYNITATGSIRGNNFTDDNGIVYQISENATGGVIADSDRTLAYFDLLEKLSENNYKIRVNYIYSPLCKDAVVRSNASEDALAEDPLYIMEGWISGGYVNLMFEFTYKGNSSTRHLINLVYDDSQPSDTLRFNFTHNGYGEGFAGEGNLNGLSSATSFACFDISALTDDLFPDGFDEVPVKISAPWYLVDDNGSYTGETTDIVTYGVLKK